MEDCDRFDRDDLSGYAQPGRPSRRFRRWLTAGIAGLATAGLLTVLDPILNDQWRLARNQEPEPVNSVLVQRLFELEEDPAPQQAIPQVDPAIAPDVDMHRPPVGQDGRRTAPAPDSERAAPASSAGQPSPDSDGQRTVPAGGFVRGSSEGGIESQPVSLALLAPAILAAAVTQRSVARGLDEFLPTSGPTGTSPVGSVPRQTLLPTLADEGIGNSIESRAVDFRTNRHDPATTTAVVLLMKTPGDQAYWHEYAACARFHGWDLTELQSVPADRQGASAWFWYCVAEHPPSGRRKFV